MFLKSLELYGFKSFAERTKLIFKPGVTAIVGPNGCGKSNIVDAIRWVLGESNARSLRGDVMNDVIFAGAEGVKPLGLAEVEVVIANENNLLPIEYTEVSIKRRLYRSGESEYFINKKSVRLKDIHELFADTGIGKPAYSIMEQGNIDMLLSTHPEERIAIFEEAAGITKYRMRIKESYKKLNNTDENLIRLDLVINEIEKEYRSLERQAEKAKKYRALKSKEREYEKNFAYLRVKELEERLTDSEKKLKSIKEKKIKLESEKRSHEKLIKEKIDEIRDKENEVIEIKNKIYKLESEINTLSSKILHLNERIEDLENQYRIKKEILSKYRKQKDNLIGSIQKTEQEIKNLKEMIASQDKKLKSYEDEVLLIDNKIKRLIEEKREIAVKINSVNNELAELRQNLKIAIDKLLRELDVVKKRLVESQEEKNRAIKDIDSLFFRIEMEIDKTSKKVRDLDILKTSDEFKRYLENIVDDLKTVKSNISTLKKDFNSVFTVHEKITGAIFGKEGIHTQKEYIENNIEDLINQEDVLKDKDKTLQKDIEGARQKHDEFIKIIGNIKPEIARNNEKLKNLENSLKRMKSELENINDTIEDTIFDIDNLERRVKVFKKEIDDLQSKKDNIARERDKLNYSIEDQNTEIEKSMKFIKELENKIERIDLELNKVNKDYESADLKRAEIRAKISSIVESFYDRFGESLKNYKPEDDLNLEDVRSLRDKIKNELRSLGQVNLLALEELEEVKKRYDYLNQQKEDLIKAKDDLNNIVSKTLDVSKKQFNSTLKEIKNNFNHIFRRLFGGGRTDIYLTHDDLFKAGIEIVAVPPGKKTSKKSLLSGGEKTLTAIAILFAIFMVKPSPFCFLDEVDHDLDEENVVRFLNLLKEFTDTTQFIIITHNRRTMEFADVIYGVTNEQAGVSKVVSLDMVERNAGLV